MAAGAPTGSTDTIRWALANVFGCDVVDVAYLEFDCGTCRYRTVALASAQVGILPLQQCLANLRARSDTDCDYATQSLV